MNVSNEKLKRALKEVWEKEDARLREEMKYCEPHVFSEEFEQKMEALFTDRGRHKTSGGFRRCFVDVLGYVAIAVTV